MARYTVEVETLMKNNTPLFDFSYAFYTDFVTKAELDALRAIGTPLPTKDEFQQHFLQRFKHKEICASPVGRWKDYLKDTFTTKLPYYNMLFRTAMIDYQKTVNYDLTETFSQTNTNQNNQTGNTYANGSNAESGSNNNTLNHSGNSSSNDEKTQTLNHSGNSSSKDDKTGTLNSTVDKTNATDFTKNETISDTSTSNKTSDRNTDLLHIEALTPQSELAVADIKKGKFASKVTYDDNSEGVIDKETITASKTDNNKENTENTGKDITTASSTDKSTVTNTDNSTDTSTDKSTNTSTNSATDTSTGSNNQSSTFNNTVNNTQNTSETGTQTYTKNLHGSYGVITEADMLQKHINLQRTLTKIENDFFDECNDLFMQVYDNPYFDNQGGSFYYGY
jgi:hypothetical protein